MRTRALPLILALGFLTAALAGCIAAAEDAPPATEPAPAEDAAANEGTMTADETVEEDEGLNTGVPPLHYKQRTHTLQGDLTLATLPVDLATVNGEIRIAPGEADRWGLVATLAGYGATPTDAQENLDRLTFTWSHEAPDGHHLVASIEREEHRPANGPVNVHLGPFAESELVLTLPPSLVATLSARTTNGAITVSDLTAGGLTLETTNANVRVHDVTAETLDVDTTNARIDVVGVTADVVDAESTNGMILAELTGPRDVRLASTSGDIHATIVPGGDGHLEAATTNGHVKLVVPEADAYGYDAVLDTTNGRATVSLEDGDKRGHGSEEATFVTHGLDGRNVRVDVELESTNGDVHLGPAST